MTFAARRRFLAVVTATLASSVALLYSSHLTAGAATFGTPIVVSSLNDSEPGVDVAADGTVYVNAIPGLSVPGPSPSHLWRSDTNGASFVLTSPGTRSAFPGGGDFDIGLDPVNGKIFGTDLWLGSATVSVSADKGSTWLANPYSTPIQDRQWIASPGGDRVYHVTHQVPSGLVVAKSVDGGISYPVSHVAATPADQTGCICPPGTLITEDGGLLGDKVGVVYSTSAGGVKFARSANGGVTFAQSVVSPASSADTISAFPVVANGGGNRLAAVWMEILNGRSRIQAATSTNWGTSWSAPKTIVSAGTSVYPWIGVRGTKIGVSTFHTDTTGTPSNVANSASWYEKYTESADFGATWTPLTAIDSAVVKTGPICTDGINCSSDRELGDFQSMLLDGAGNAHLTWARSLNGSNDTEIRYVRQS